MASLTLPETLLLLGFDAEKGTTRHGLAMNYALAGAQLHELALAGRVTVEPERVALVDATPVDRADRIAADDVIATAVKRAVDAVRG